MTQPTKPSVLYNGELYLDPIVTSITWSGDITQAFRQLTVEIKNTVDGVSQAVNIELGRELRLLTEDDVELFRGVIFSFDINATGAPDGRPSEIFRKRPTLPDVPTCFIP